MGRGLLAGEWWCKFRARGGGLGIIELEWWCFGVVWWRSGCGAVRSVVGGLGAYRVKIGGFMEDADLRSGRWRNGKVGGISGE